MFQQLSPNSQKTMISLYRNHFEQEINQTQNVNELLSTWRKKNLAPATLKKLLSIYRTWYVYKYGKSPSVPKIEEIQKTAKAWTKEEIEKILNVSYNLDRELHTVILFAFNTGMRKGEVFGMRWEDVDFHRKQILVRRSYSGPTKSRRARTVPMTDTVYNFLKERKSKGLIFRTFDPNKKLKKICGYAGVKTISFHGLRHTFATIALESGKINIRDVSDILGHKNLSTTIDIYWNLTSKQLDLSFL